MTRYTVIWRDPVKNHLARIWLAATYRAAVTAASDAIDAELAEDANSKGTPVGTKFRRLVISPLDALFAVLVLDRQVHVLSIKRV